MTELVPLAADTERAYGDLVAFYRKTFRTEDTAPLDVCLATVATSTAPGDALWVFIVGAPSNGKTEIIRALKPPNQKWPTYSLSSLTPHTFVSGLTEGGHDLLPDLDGKTLLVKDFTVILGMPRERREEILGQLRDIYDGTFEPSFGTRGKVTVDAHLNLVAGVTGVIERYYGVMSVLGQRFLLVRTSFPDDFDSDSERDIEAIRTEFQSLVVSVLKACPSGPLPSCSFVPEIKTLAREVAILRTHVPREGPWKDVASVPESEAPPRLTNQLLKVARGIAKVRGHREVTKADLQLALRVARDTVPSMRRAIVDAVVFGNEGEGRTVDEVASAIGLSHNGAARQLEDLTLLGFLDEETSGKSYRYSVARKFMVLP